MRASFLEKKYVANERPNRSGRPTLPANRDRSPRQESQISEIYTEAALARSGQICSFPEAAFATPDISLVTDHVTCLPATVLSFSAEGNIRSGFVQDDRCAYWLAS